MTNTDTTDIGTSLTPAEMTRSHWTDLMGRLATFITEDSLNNFSLNTGRVITIREGAGEVVLADVTRTRATGSFAGEIHRIPRRMIPLVKVRRITWLAF